MEDSRPIEGSSIPVYMEYTDSRSKKHQIVKGWKYVQSKLYEEAVTKGDVVAMHYLILPYHDRPHWQIQAAIEMIELPYQCEDRAERLVKEMEFQVAMEKTKKQMDPERRYLISLIIALVIVIIISVLR